MPVKEKSEAKSSDAQNAVSEYKGWQISHEQEPRSVVAPGPTGTVAVVHDAVYEAVKRHELGFVEFQDSTIEGLKKKIEGWERTQPSDTAPQLSEEQLLNSARATLHQSITAGARPTLEVDLTLAADKPKPRGVNLSVNQPVEETDMDDDDAAGLATLSSTSGVGEGTTPGP